LANSSSAEKRNRQNMRRAAQNRQQRSTLKTAIKQVVKADDGESATQAFKRASALLDRFGTRRLIHPNKAARKKSQLARIVTEKGGTA
jgi:small subunit ribosomal protein S20